MVVLDCIWLGWFVVSENWGYVVVDIVQVHAAVDQLVKRMVFAVHLLNTGLASRKIHAA